MATVLTGRYLQINILPFSFLETVEYNNVDIKFDTPNEKAILMQQLYVNSYMGYGDDNTRKWL